MAVIEIKNLTKDYGDNRGVFDVSLEIPQGEVFGFLGPNGAGKTTTIRHLLGFSRAQQGSASIYGIDCREHPEEIQRFTGYIPGEIAFPDNMTGMQFIEMIAEMRGLKDLTRAKELMEMFELNPKGELKRMSKGMKQKIALVIAFMHSPEILILDEPTSGLDPLMQARFVELIAAEKKRGATIFMSSHMFDEVEKTCDRVAIIKQGKIMTTVKMKDIEHRKDKQFEIKFKSKEDAEKFSKEPYEFDEVNIEKTRVKVTVNDERINEFLKTLSALDLVYMREIKYTLEKYFMHFYGKEEKANETV